VAKNVSFEDQKSLDDSAKTQENSNNSSKKSKGTPFRRINPDVINSLNPQLSDNSFQSKKGDNWGSKAANSFGAVKGKNFKKEKTKKKRGSYSGGYIDTSQVNSVKFE